MDGPLAGHERERDVVRQREARLADGGHRRLAFPGARERGRDRGPGGSGGGDVAWRCGAVAAGLLALPGQRVASRAGRGGGRRSLGEQHDGEDDERGGRGAAGDQDRRPPGPRGGPGRARRAGVGRGWRPGNVARPAGTAARCAVPSRPGIGRSQARPRPHEPKPAGARGADGSTRRSRRSRALGRRAGSLSRHSRTTVRRDGGRPLTSGSSYMIRCMTAGTLSAPNTAGRWRRRSSSPPTRRCRRRWSAARRPAARAPRRTGCR